MITVKIVTPVKINLGESFSFTVNGNFGYYLKNIKREEMAFFSAIYDHSFQDSFPEIDFYGNGQKIEVIEFELEVSIEEVQYPNCIQKFIVIQAEDK